ncbi:MAG TPA: DUF2231 domain-containing protein [Polyangiaceae bacterium]|nr:DUF2231 domain-containing protein [Polyangiaceae bacterium]
MRLFGHPVHPIAVTLPLAFLGAVPACDLLAWSGLLADGWLLGHYSIIVGLLGGAVALASGLSDLLTIEDPDAELSRNALTHAALAVSALVVFVTAFLLRPEAGAPVSTGVLVLEIVGAATLGLAGWFGGHLVFEHGVAVRRSRTASAPEPRNEATGKAEARTP